ncbi:uncharacterized protein L3040_006753 [Drepanopeziza brunnea f. sp. 'multigermtubi']|uniref:uncharacterized protein n=1 Tax=Drepanopeziza brunnea f. sp. 'multigermtubi' TaxID=698441 RepID=UPI0023A1FCE5|nr:hypothetical protein L3040_006753 [Drepanopeziza brunnea f. sp. 'multigermtubi']
MKSSFGAWSLLAVCCLMCSLVNSQVQENDLTSDPTPIIAQVTMPAVVTTIKALTTLFATRSDGVGTAIPTIDVVITLTPARTVADETKTGPISIPQATGTSQAHVVPSASGFKYLGCYTEADNRALAGASFPDDSNTVKKCAANCARFKYAGVEYGRECYCSDTLKSGSTAASENECNMACGGNSLELCGGSVRLNVYIREEDWSSPSVTSPATLTIESAATPSLSTSPGMSLSASNSSKTLTLLPSGISPATTVTIPISNPQILAALAISPPLPATPSSAQVTSTINLSSAPENPTSVIVNHDTTATRTSFVTTTHTFTTTRSNAPIQTSSPLSSSPDFARTTAWSSYLSDTYPVLSRPTIPIPIFTPNSLMCLSTNATQHPADTATPPATSLSSVSVSVSVSVPPSSALPSPSPKSTPASPGSAAPPATNNASITSTSATNNASTVRITTIRRPGPGLGPSGTRSTASPGPVSRDLQGRRAGALLVCVVAVMMVFAF